MKNYITLILSIYFILLPKTFYTQNNSGLPPVYIGILLDGPWERNDAIIELLKNEVDDLLSGEYNIHFPPDMTIDCGWEIDNMITAHDKLQNDDKVDLIIAYGEIVSNVTVFAKEYKKPVIAAVAVNAELQRMPLKDGASGIKNLNYITFTASLKNQVPKLKEFFEFQNATLFLNELYLDQRDDREFVLPEEFKFVDVNFTIVSVDKDNYQNSIARIPANTEAVINYPLFYFSRNQLEDLTVKILDKGIPIFTIFDETQVEMGALAGLIQKEFFEKLTRRIALNIQRILMGEEPGEIPVQFPVEEELYINMATVKKLKIYPSWNLMSDAKLINEKPEQIKRIISLGDAVGEALVSNLDLAAKNDEVLAGLEDVRIARSELLPQLEISGVGTLIDKNSAESSFGSRAEKTILGSATLTQLLYSEKAWANLNIQEIRQEIKNYENAQLNLDIIQETATAYLNILRAKTNESIQKDNLAVSKSNLEIARFREDVGYAGASEVYRWESQIATNRKSLIESNAQRNLTEIELNKILHRPLEEKFETETADLDKLMETISDKRLTFYYGNKWYFKILRQYLSKVAFTYSPELMIINKLIEAQERALTSNNNSLFLPTIALQGQLNNSFYRGGAGSEVEPITIPNIGTFSFAQEPKDLNWNIGLNLSLPLYLGGSRYADIAKSKLEISRLNIEKKRIEDLIEQGIRSTLHLSGASYAGLEQANKAAEAAKSNLDLVIDSYSRGVVSIIDLIDAQNASLTANEGAASAEFDFLNDLMDVQRALGAYIVTWTSEEREKFFKQLDEYFQENIGKID